MCLLCIDIAKGKITWKEARRNLSEMQLDAEHKRIVEEAIDDLVIEDLAGWFENQRKTNGNEEND